MNTPDIAVTAGAVMASLGLLWFFFGSRTRRKRSPWGSLP